MNKSSKILITGHRGMVGSAVIRHLKAAGYENVFTSGDLDLRCQERVYQFFRLERPDYVFLLAGKVGGVKANNTYRAEFIYDNAMIELNVIHASFLYKVKKLLFTGSSCIYPAHCSQPIKEEYFLTGTLEPTNEPYAIAKIAGIKMCEAYRTQYGCNYISAMPTNSYGPADHYGLEKCHVLPALLRKIIDARDLGQDSVEIWGSGEPRREFLYVDDMAEALVFLMEHYNQSDIINVGTGVDITISDLATTIASIVGYKGRFVYNNQLDGMMLKRLDVTKINALGWKAKTTLFEGLEKTVKLIEEKKPW